MGVFANGLEISGKSVGAKTIAAMPDVCMTPPESPATPPGVPVPYPSFGMAGDTDKGTGKVMIGGKEVNLKNKSFLSKTTGTEAGCAAKKGVVSSKNTGKAYFISWSNDVKFEGEPVIRNTDMSTQNHGSDPPNAPPWPHIASLNMSMADCDTLLIKFELLPLPYDELDCSEKNKNGKKYEKEHTVENQFFACRGLRSQGEICKHWKNYSDESAKCICMHAKYDNGRKSNASSTTRSYDVGDASKSCKGSDHKIKTAMCRDKLKHTPCMSLDEFMDVCVDSTLTCHEQTSGLEKDDPQREKLGACLKAKNKANLEEKLTPANKKDSAKKSQGQLTCHVASGKCANRKKHGKPEESISKAAAGRHDDAKKAGRCP